MLPNLQVLNLCDSHPSPQHNPKEHAELLSTYTFFQHNGAVLGYLLLPALAALRESTQDFLIGEHTVEFHPRYDPFHSRTQIMTQLLTRWRSEHKFEVLKGMRPLLS
jgi:hypothetical protein